jgi:hypothetical protein
MTPWRPSESQLMTLLGVSAPGDEHAKESITKTNNLTNLRRKIKSFFKLLVIDLKKLVDE